MVNVLRNIVRGILLLVSLLVFVFALLSGSEELGGGLMGIVRNSPNAIPWLLLLALVYVGWKWELVGGILLVLFGIAATFFFQLLQQGWTPFALIGLPPILFGVIFVALHFWSKRLDKALDNQENENS